MSKFLSKRLSCLTPYTPGEQPQDFNYVKLNTNESPFPPSPAVIKAVNSDEVSLLKLYSDPECKRTVKAIADYYGVESKNIVLGNGSDEILSFVFSAFCDENTPVAFPDISYGFYEVFASLYGIKANVIPLKEDYSLCADDYCSLNETVVIANPNAPTGILISKDDIEKIVKSNPDNVVVIDEAYIDFGGESCVSLTKKYNNLLVTQTFSKSRSMAGARLGFGVGNKELINDINTIKYSTNPYNINTMSMYAGVGVLEDEEYTQKNCKAIIENRNFTIKELEKLGFKLTNSNANFVFAKNDKIDGKELYLKLKEKGVLVRHFDKPEISEYNRITIGTKEEMEILISKIKEIMEGR